MDFNLEWIKEFPDEVEFPEFKNKYFRFFANDPSMAKGHITLGDVESEAIVNIKFETMPVRGVNHLTVGEPFYFFDVKAELCVNGEYEEIVLVDRNESLRHYRPFLMF